MKLNPMMENTLSKAYITFNVNDSYLYLSLIKYINTNKNNLGKELNK